MKINLTGYKKCKGDARRLEVAAREASSALPFTPNTVSPVDVHKEVENLQSLLKRIMEGIALQILLARKVRSYLSYTFNVNKDISDRINLPFKMLRFHFNIRFVCFRSSTLPRGMTWCHLSLGTTKKFWYSTTLLQKRSWYPTTKKSWYPTTKKSWHYPAKTTDDVVAVGEPVFLPF